jgi:hypothetical protein
MAEGLYLGKQFDPKAGELGERIDLDPARFTEQALLPVKTGVKLLRYDLVWVY